MPNHEPPSPSSNSGTPAAAPTQGLRSVLGLFSATTIVVGGVIGSGVFLKPQAIANEIGGSVGLVLSLWFVCGIVNLAGALSMAELSAMMPHAGGNYVFLRTTYGRFWAWLWAWAEFWVIRSASIAALAVAMTITLADLLKQFHVSLSDPHKELLQAGGAIFMVALLSGINILGARHGGWVQDLTTIIKATFVAFLMLVPWLALRDDPSPPTAAAPPLDLGSLASWTHVGAAVAAIMWAYDGWGNVTVVAEEIRRPQRNVPIALGGGVVLLTVLYCGANLGYHLSLDLDTLQTEDNAALAVMKKSFGEIGGRVLLCMLMISIAGALNSNVLIGPRVLFAVARDYPRLRVLSRLHPRTGTPVLAIVGLSSWAIALIAISFLVHATEKRLFEVLTDFCVFGGSLFYLATVIGVFVLRWKYPDLPRPYRTWGYPVTPLLFAAFYVFLLVGMYLASPGECLCGLGLIAAGAPVFLFVARGSRAHDAPPVNP